MDLPKRPQWLFDSWVRLAVAQKKHMDNLEARVAELEEALDSILCLCGEGQEVVRHSDLVHKTIEIAGKVMERKE